MGSFSKRSRELHPALVEAIDLAVASSPARGVEMAALQSELVSLLSKSDLPPVEQDVIRACLERVMEMVFRKDMKH